MNIPTQSELEVITSNLAKILRIQDWDITFHLVSGYEIAKETDGDSSINGLSVRLIRLNKADVYINRDNAGGWYETLVHELIHIQTTEMLNTANAFFDEPHTYFETIYESMVEKQAQIFCKLYPSSNFIKDNPDIFKNAGD